MELIGLWFPTLQWSGTIVLIYIAYNSPIVVLNVTDDQSL